MNLLNISNKIYTNKKLLKGLEKISEHGTSFQAVSSLLLSTCVRPLSIYSTPDVEKENKQYAISNSVCSGLAKFAMLESVALPIENAVLNIDKNPTKYLSPETLKRMNPNSRAYKFITQMLKLSVGMITAIPKSMLTLALIPVIMGGFKKHTDNISVSSYKNQKGSTSFTGNFTNSLSQNISKLINNKSIQKFANKYQTQDNNIFKHVTAVTDILLTSSFALQTNKSKDIKENRKKVLIYNNIISTAVTLLCGYGADSVIQKQTSGFLEKFKQANLNNPKLNKCIEGINILRPALIFALIYYAVLPIFSTYTAEKIDKFINSKQTKKI